MMFATMLLLLFFTAFEYFSMYVSAIECVSTKKKFRVFRMLFHPL